MWLIQGMFAFMFHWPHGLMIHLIWVLFHSHFIHYFHGFIKMARFIPDLIYSPIDTNSFDQDFLWPINSISFIHSKKAKSLCLTHEPMHQNKGKTPFCMMEIDYHVWEIDSPAPVAKKFISRWWKSITMFGKSISLLQ